MSTTKHTQGPWDWHGPYMAGGYKVSALDNNGHQAMQAFVDRGESHAKNEANARLIAAAPELLEALQTLLDAVEGKRVTVGDCNQAHAAIAKAIGKAK